ncbi:MAG: rhodanese-like domain-containing protein [Cecembia sp.]
MKPLISVFFVLFFLYSWNVGAQSIAYRTLLKGIYDKDFPTVQIEDQELLNSALFLDTREKDEYEVSHIQGALWVGFEEFDLKIVNNLDRNQPLVVYCSIGARSQEIGKKLKKAGFKEVYNLYGGIFHWVNEGLPVYANGHQTQKVHAYNRAWGIWLSKGEKVY